MKTENKTSYSTKLFTNPGHVETAYQNALDRGYTPEDVSVVMSEDTRTKHFTRDGKPTVIGDKSMEGLAIGGAAGGAIGGAAAAIAAIGTALVIPGLGLVVAGPLAAGLAGIGAGSIAGGLIGTLIGWGIPEERVKEYEQGIKKGGVLMAVRHRGDQTGDDLDNDWKKY